MADLDNYMCDVKQEVISKEFIKHKSKVKNPFYKLLVYAGIISATILTVICLIK